MKKRFSTAAQKRTSRQIVAATEFGQNLGTGQFAEACALLERTSFPPRLRDVLDAIVTGFARGQSEAKLAQQKDAHNRARRMARRIVKRATTGLAA